jgi:hypothetical protein
MGGHDVQAHLDGAAVGGPPGVSDVEDPLVRGHPEELGLFAGGRPDAEPLGDADLGDTELSKPGHDAAGAGVVFLKDGAGGDVQGARIITPAPPKVTSRV